MAAAQRPVQGGDIEFAAHVFYPRPAVTPFHGMLALLMADPGKSLDLTGLGKAAHAIPPDAWRKVVDAALDIVRPFTAFLGGTGRLVEQKFDRLTEAEKVSVAGIVEQARPRLALDAAPGRRDRPEPNGKVLTGIIEGSAVETDATIRGLWANLLANEITEGGVHPEFLGILKRMTHNDAVRLAELAKLSARTLTLEQFVVGLGKLLQVAASIDFADAAMALGKVRINRSDGFTDEHLQSLGLLRIEPKGGRHLTATAFAFLQAVSDHTLEVSGQNSQAESSPVGTEIGLPDT